MSNLLTVSEVLIEADGFGLDDLISQLEAEWRGPADGDVGSSAPAGTDASGRPVIEKRRSRRLKPEEFGREVRLTIVGAAEAATVNLSETGVLTETAQRLCPGRTVDVFVRIDGVRRVVRATVIRCSVHAVHPRPLFRAALQFAEAINHGEPD